MWTQRTTLLFAASLFGPASLAAPEEGHRPPNLIVILADDFGYECLGANGGPYATASLDRLAREGMRFEHCYAQPLCTPTRVQLLTGVSNARNYVRFGYLDPRSLTLAHVLRHSGYRTAVAGKWQLGGGADAPRRAGFDEHLLWQLSGRGSRYANPVLELNGRRMEAPAGSYGPDLVSDFVCDFIRRTKDRPFFLYYPLLLVHPPFEPTPLSPDWDPRAAGAQEGRGDPRHFPAMVAYTDRVVGRLLSVLDDLGLRENTLVLFLGDNGTPPSITTKLGDRQVAGGKGKTTDAGTRVPLIVRWPGVVPPAQTADDLVDTCDVFATLLDAAGARLPDGATIDGRSFVPRLRGERGRGRSWIYSWFARDGGPDPAEFARDRRFKLYRGGRFFDVAEDPLELHPLEPRDLDPAGIAARSQLDSVLASFRDARRPGGWEASARALESAGIQLFRTGGRVVEAQLNRRPVDRDTMRRLGELEDLTDLSLEETRVGDEDVRCLALLTKLEWLNLYRTELGDEGLEILSALPSLRHLPAGETRVTDAGLVHLARMPRLEYLGLRGDKITDAGMEPIARLENLRGLHLGGTLITSTGVRTLTGRGRLVRLEKLWLDDTSVDDSAVELLGKLVALRELHVAGSKLTPKGVAALRAALPECEVETEK